MPYCGVDRDCCLQPGAFPVGLDGLEGKCGPAQAHYLEQVGVGLMGGSKAAQGPRLGSPEQMGQEGAAATPRAR